MGYIYKITNLVNNKSYIGQTIQPYKERWNRHIRDALSNTVDSHKRFSLHYAIKKYGVENFDFSLIEEIPNTRLNEREQYWISYYDTYNNGYNETLGGGGFQKYDYEEIAKTYQQIPSLRKVANLFGCDTNVVHNACVANHVPILNSGTVTQSELGKPVCQIDPASLTILARYPSATNAAITVFNDRSKNRNILACCNHKQKIAYGYGWIYEGDDIPKNLNRNEKYRLVVQKDKNTRQVLQIFKSGAEAARSLGKGESAASVILKVCKDPKLKTAYGYIWEYGDTNDS